MTEGDEAALQSMGFAESERLMHEIAARQAGADDFGDPSYLEGLRVLLHAYDGEAHFNAYGRMATRQMVIDLLAKRARAEKLWSDKPLVLGGEIGRPIVICGLIRTGSTALHYLMGQDPDMQNLQYWLASSPQPRPPREAWPENPDFQHSVAELDAMYEADPSLKAIHFMMADGPEECRHLFSQCFTDDGFEVNASVPSYSDWYERVDMGPTYRRHRQLIQLIGSTDAERRWLLKYPVHVRNLQALLEVYPDACIVWTHRDPASVLPSYCSLIAGFRAIYEEGTNPRQMAERQLELWARGLQKGIDHREQCDSSQFYDLHFHDFVADPVGSVRSIYACFGQHLSEDGERRLAKWQADNPQHKHGRHEYSDEIGIGRDQIHDQFGAYMDYFGMKPEGN